LLFNGRATQEECSMSIFTLFILICGVLALSLLFSVLNMVLQARIASRITLLEKELDKKTLAFDSLKKERASLYTQAQQNTPAVELSTQYQVKTEPQLVDDGEIRVVRNVRGTFTPAMDTEEPLPSTTMQTDSAPGETSDAGPVRKSAPTIAAQPEEYPDDTKRWQQNMPTATPRTHAPVARYPALQAPVASNPPVVIALFSQAAGGLDFNAVYETLITVLKSQTTQSIAFDCGGIQFLSDPELEYLEKIFQSLVAQNRTLQLLNCCDALVDLLQRQPDLASLVR
jgi:hypothetical protein